MSGIVYHVLPETTYDWSTATANQTIVHDVARAVDVAMYREATLVVRMHRFNSYKGGAKVKVDVFPEAPTDEDPLDFILDSAVGTTNQILQAGGGVSFPYAFEAQLSTPFGAWLRIRLTLTQDDTDFLTANATISIDIMAKS